MLIWIGDNSKFEIFDKNIFSLTFTIDGKTLLVYLLNNLKYNLFSLSIIQKASYSTLARNEKITVFDNENNFVLAKTIIGIGHLVDISSNKIYQALTFS